MTLAARRRAGGPAPGARASIVFDLLLLWVALAGPFAPLSAAGAEPALSVFDASGAMASGGRAIWRLILDEVARKEHWSIRYVEGTYSEGLRRLAEGRIDLLTSVPHHQAVGVAGAVSQEAVISTWAQIYTHPDTALRSLPDLSGHTVGVVMGDFNNPDSRNVLNGLDVSLKLIEFKTGDELLEALEKKWVDAAVVDRLFGAVRISRYHVIKTDFVFSPMDYRFAASPALADRVLGTLDYHLRAMKKDPGSSYRRHLEAIFGQNGNPRLLKHLKYGLIATGLCLLAVSVNVLVLRYRVRARTSELASKNRDLEEALVRMQDAEKARCASESRFFSLFHASPTGIVIHDLVCDASGRPLDYIFSEANPAFSRHTGLRVDRVAGRPASEVFQTAPPFLDTFAGTVANGKPLRFETFFAAIGRHVQITAFALENRRFATVFEDVSDRKAAELSVRRSEEKYRQLVDNAHDLIVVVNRGRLRFANPAARRVFGYEEQDFDTLSLADVVHPGDRRTILALHPDGRSRMPKSGYHTFRALTKSGVVRWLQMNAVPIDWEGGPAALCIIRDITTAKQMEIQLAQAQKMQAIGNLAGGVAHDFNNILTAILGYTELCQAQLDGDDGLRRNLGQIYKAGIRAKDLVNQILMFSHQEEKVEKPIDIGNSLVEALKLLRATIPTSIDIRHDIRTDAAIVLADPTQIHQIVMNLSTNAAHAMQEEGGILDIRLENCRLGDPAGGAHPDLRPGPYVVLTVSDTGHGMTPETLQRIFDPYYTTKKQGEGTGLGLSMVHGIVKSLKGGIEVASEPGAGTRFKLYFPRIETRAEAEPRKAPAVPGGGERILLVDDEEMVMDYASEMLGNLGYRVASRTSSVEAWKLFQRRPERFDLVISDQTMPGLTGKELARRILDIRPATPVILCTGFSASIDEEKALAMGIRAFIRKPILQNDLATVVRRVLDEKPAGAALLGAAAAG